MFRESEKSLTKTPRCTFVMVTKHEKCAIVSSTRENEWIVMKFQVQGTKLEAIDENKTWKMMTTHNNGSHPEVL
jgi:hypothetical protein